MVDAINLGKVAVEANNESLPGQDENNATKQQPQKQDIFEFSGKIWCAVEGVQVDDLRVLLETNSGVGRLNFAIEQSPTATDRLILVCSCPLNIRWRPSTWNTVLRVFFGISENPTAGLENDEGEQQQQQEPQQQTRQTKLMQRYVTTQLYEALWQSHRPQIVQNLENNTPLPLPLPECFQPTLRAYQERTVRWMLQRECQPTTACSFFSPALPTLGWSQATGVLSIYRHLYCMELRQSASPPPPIELPPGGILAEEMGLGKTVELLALILLHPRPPFEATLPATSLPAEISQPRADDETISSSASKAKRARSTITLFCCCSSTRCGNTSLLVQCGRCALWQHAACVAPPKDDRPALSATQDPYMCPSCWHEQMQQSSQPLPTRATFIVSPAAIKPQWLSEIERHIQPLQLRVLLYNGVSAGHWLNPRQLADYDLVLCDYNVLRSEIYYTDAYTSDRAMRQKPRFMRLHTPLLMLQWWRVCLDEAQMVESNTSLVASLVRQLPAVNRWAVTGTPIQRSIDDLCPLLRFIGFYEPCEPVSVWKKLVGDFLRGQQQQQQQLALTSTGQVQQPRESEPSDLIERVLRHCMWRTCKTQVVEELGIPPQSERLHRIQLGNLERLFYTEQHADCAEDFRTCMRKYVEQGSAAGVLAISPHIMKLILQPLLKIRQCCNIPVVLDSRAHASGGGGGGGAVTQKQFLQPKQLHAHLKATNELECKTELRTMASSFNGMAAICFLRKDYNEAIRYYELVLKLARDYKNCPYRVDSLLQIHALHNILQAHYSTSSTNGAASSAVSVSGGGESMQTANFTADNIAEYEKQCSKLEWDYLGPYAAQMISVKNSFVIACNEHQRHTERINCNLAEFLAAGVGEMQDSQIDPLMQKIYNDCMPMFANKPTFDSMHSTRGVLYVLHSWNTKVERTVNLLVAKFEKLEFFTGNVWARSQLGPGMWREKMQFITSVYDCHLSEIREGPQKNSPRKGKTGSKKRKPEPKKELCELCRIREEMNNFECLLFDKRIDKESNCTEGLEVPSAEFTLAKSVCAFFKARHRSAATEEQQQQIVAHVELLENLQYLCKKIIRYWIEIEYLVKAYDELDMCKMRMSLETDKDDRGSEAATEDDSDASDKEVGGSKIKWRVKEFELDSLFLEQHMNLQRAQYQFRLKLARLKYIMHLEANADPGICPICHTDDEERYAVLECGHYICLACLRKMRQYKRQRNTASLTCAICRNEQSSKKIYYVTRTMNPALGETEMGADDQPPIQLKGNYSTKITYLVQLILKLCRDHEQGRLVDEPKILIFSQWQPVLKALAAALAENEILHRFRWCSQSIEDFKNASLGITCLLMTMGNGSKGLNLIEANHVFLVEPILNPGEELQAVGRVHRFGQTKATTVHRFIVRDTIEENVYNLVTAGQTKQANWEFENTSLDDLKNLFKLKSDLLDDNDDSDDDVDIDDNDVIDDDE